VVVSHPHSTKQRIAAHSGRVATRGWFSVRRRGDFSNHHFAGSEAIRPLSPHELHQFTRCIQAESDGLNPTGSFQRADDVAVREHPHETVPHPTHRNRSDALGPHPLRGNDQAVEFIDTGRPIPPGPDICCPTTSFGFGAHSGSDRCSVNQCQISAVSRSVTRRYHLAA